MYALLGALPIILIIFMMLFLKMSAGMTMFWAWLASGILAVIFWNMEIFHAGALTVLGFLSALDIIFIIFSAIFLLNTLMELKFIETIGNGFHGISQDRRIQILIIAWFFGAFMEGAAGFGTPAALAAPLLMGLGVPAFFAALAGLIANSTPVLFGAVGTPTTAGFRAIEPAIVAQYGAEGAVEFAGQLNNYLSFANIFVGVFVPFMIIAAIVARDGRKRGIKDALNILPLCLFAGLIFNIPAWLASFLGPELPTLVGALVGLPIMIICVKAGFLVPKDVYRFTNDPITLPTESSKTGISLFTAWSPYILIALVLMISRLPWLPIARLINPMHAADAPIQVTGLLGVAGINWNWRIFNNPGLFVFLPVAIIYLIVRKKQAGATGRIFGKTFKQVVKPALTLLFGVALVQIMIFTNFSDPASGLGTMTTEIARALADTLSGVYMIIAPLIGGLGAFVAGSHTVSNLMFFGLQIETAALLNLPMIAVLIAQASGGAFGNMIAIHNVVTVSATTGAGTKGREHRLISAAIVPFFIYWILISAVLYVMLAVGMNWIG